MLEPFNKASDTRSQDGEMDKKTRFEAVSPQSPGRSRMSTNTAQQLQFNNYMARLIPSKKQNDIYFIYFIFYIYIISL